MQRLHIKLLYIWNLLTTGMLSLASLSRLKQNVFDTAMKQGDKAKDRKSNSSLHCQILFVPFLSLYIENKIWQ